MIRPLTLLVLLFIVHPVCASDPFTFASPKGWRSERIPFPLGFAKELKYRGFEELRFGPGMFQPKSDSYWTYAFFWWVKGDVSVDQKSLEKDLLNYYRGLSRAVGSSRGMKIDPQATKVRLTPAKAAGSATAPIFTGKLHTYDAFATGKLLKLNFEVSRRYFGQADHTWVFFSVSPHDRQHKLWKQMHAFRDSFRVK